MESVMHYNFVYMVNVLVVEDDIVLCLLTRKNIELMGHKVVAVATRGAEAIAAVKKYKPDVILMDIFLEGDSDGINTMHEIAKFDDVPAIYFTSGLEKTNEARAAETNMLAFYTKPINFGELEATLNNIEKRARA